MPRNKSREKKTAYSITHSLLMATKIWWSMYVICSATSSADRVSMLSLLGVWGRRGDGGGGRKGSKLGYISLNIEYKRLCVRVCAYMYICIGLILLLLQLYLNLEPQSYQYVLYYLFHHSDSHSNMASLSSSRFLSSYFLYYIFSFPKYTIFFHMLKYWNTSIRSSMCRQADSKQNWK